MDNNGILSKFDERQASNYGRKTEARALGAVASMASSAVQAKRTSHR
jgi:hypothetical protein